METLFFVFEIIGTIAFALSGAMKGIKRNMDIFGVAILGIVTGIGGGVVRDGIIGNTPAIALKNSLFSLIALATALVTFCVVALLWNRIKAEVAFYDRVVIFSADTLGLAVFTLNGISIARENGIDNFAALVFIGVITGAGGGVIRDVFCGEVPDVFKKHVYAVASAVGGSVTLLLWDLVPEWMAVSAGLAAVIILRFLAAHFRWNLPKINPDTL